MGGQRRGGAGWGGGGVFGCGGARRLWFVLAVKIFPLLRASFKNTGAQMIFFSNNVVNINITSIPPPKKKKIISSFYAITLYFVVVFNQTRPCVCISMQRGNTSFSPQRILCVFVLPLLYLHNENNENEQSKNRSLGWALFFIFFNNKNPIRLK